ncbi:MAG: hypothetical protein JHD35_26070 [Sphingopyxis sp.]|nr:hypothetical protein [Sphingopyxis sp.]
MVKKSRAELMAEEINGRLVQDWDADWRQVPAGFAGPHPDLKRYVGLARAVREGETMYILRAIEHDGGGLAKGLRRISGPNQTGNAGYGAQKIREHMSELTLEVLCVGTTAVAARHAERLKTLMIKLHDPEWNRPATARLKKLRSGC